MLDVSIDGVVKKEKGNGNPGKSKAAARKRSKTGQPARTHGRLFPPVRVSVAWHDDMDGMACTCRW